METVDEYYYVLGLEVGAVLRHFLRAPAAPAAVLMRKVVPALMEGRCRRTWPSNLGRCVEYEVAIAGKPARLLVVYTDKLAPDGRKHMAYVRSAYVATDGPCLATPRPRLRRR